MKLTFLYHPVEDVADAATFHRDELGLDEAWREGSDTVAFWLPDRSAQIMVSTTDQPAGPMYLVDSVDVWLATHPAIGVAIDRYDIPGGEVVGLAGPNGYVFYVFDQPNA
jgi:hypothetical protein